MSLTQIILVNPKTTTLRSGWQVVIFAVMFWGTASVILSLAFSMLEGLNLGSPRSSFSVATLLTNSLCCTAAVVTATWYCLRLFPQPSFGYMGYAVQPWWWRDAGIGLASGIGLLSVVMLATWLTRKSEVHAAHPNIAALSLAFGQGWVLFTFGAMYEELLFRGFAFQALQETLSKELTIAITAVLFSAVHAANPNVTPLALANTLLAGVWLGVARYKRGSLWLATGLHIGWNFATVWVWGVPVSGLSQTFHATALTTQIAGPQWLTGGIYGPEGGILCTLVLALATLGMAVGMNRTKDEG